MKDQLQSTQIQAWSVVAASFFGLTLSYAMFTVFSFGAFVAPLQAEFGWSRGSMSLALIIANATVVVIAPLMGVLVDRLGARRVVIVSTSLLGPGVAAMSLLTPDLRHYYLMHFLLPLVGAGTLPLVYSRVIVGWFRNTRGLALGLALSGFGVGAAVVPAMAQTMIDWWGWREAYLAFGVLICLVSVPTAALFLREAPRDTLISPGLESGPANSGRSSQAQSAEEGLGIFAAVRTAPFWLLVVSVMLVSIGISAILAHLVPMLIDRGIPPARAAMAMSLLGLGLIAGRILSGYLMDRVFAPYIAASFQVGMITGLVLLALDFSGTAAFVAGILVGLATGSEITEISYLVSRYFGTRAFGLIYGVLFSAFHVGAGIGAYVMGAYHDHAGHYLGALWAVTGSVILSTALLLMLGPYPHFPSPMRSPETARTSSG